MTNKRDQDQTLLEDQQAARDDERGDPEIRRLPGHNPAKSPQVWKRQRRAPAAQTLRMFNPLETSG